jgi:membrane peptidoglycan carboxypeptidase
VAEVRALTGGRDYFEQPWNLATQAQHPPGDAIMPMARALGRDTADQEVAALARAAGVRTTLTTGFPQGVTPVDMAAVYLTVANGGERTTGSLSSPVRGTVGVREIAGIERNKAGRERVMEPEVAEAVATQLRDAGDGGRLLVAPAPGGAWAVGYDARRTCAVWIGSSGRDLLLPEAPALAERAWRALMAERSAREPAYSPGGASARALPRRGLPSVSRSLSQKRRRPSAWW